MRRLSENAAKLVKQLYELDKESGWFGRPSNCSDIIACLLELSASKELASVTCICRFIFSRDPGVRSAAREAVGEILLGVAPAELMQLSDAFGWEYGWYAGSAWNNLKTSEVAGVAEASGQPDAAVLGLLSFHQNGYIREEAVKQLSPITSGTELPFLLIRQNDWVEPISKLAQAHVEKRLTTEYVEHFTRNIEIVAHLPEFGRNDLSATTDAMFGQLLLAKHDELLKTTLKTCGRSTVRRLIKRGLELLGDQAERLAQYGMEADDVITRLWCARYLLNVAPDDKLADQLLADVFAPIRREAYQAKAERNQHAATEVWKQAAFDRSIGNRDFARFHLRKSGEVDIHQLYLENLSTNPDSLPALAGVSEFAREEDTGLLRQYLQHKYPNRRKMAVAGLARVLGEEMAAELVNLLKDESPAVAKQAEKCLKEMTPAIDCQQLFVVLENSPTDSGRHAILRLFYEMGKWRSLPWFIRSVGLGNPFINEHAEGFAYDWLVSNSVFTKPSEDERKATQNAYREVSQSIPESFKKKLEEFVPFAVEHH